jgi:nicotinate-nucleotide pyrophosphorylase (carboxylating)
MIDFLNHPETDRIITAALQEDLGEGDHTTLSTIPADAVARARCLIKEAGVLAGVAVARRIFETVDPALEMEVFLEDGQRVQPVDVPFVVAGSARSILQAERLMLNILQRMSGIATRTRAVVDRLEGLNCRVLDTRKTTPLIRHLEKWAVQIGGGVNHRFGLYDMILIKDNHIDYAGGIAQALQASRAYLADRQLDLKIEIETRNLDEVREVLANGGADRILLDNMSLEELRAAVELIDGRTETEASGNITLETVRPVAETGVDYVSMGALTHSVQSLDISLKAY